MFFSAFSPAFHRYQSPLAGAFCVDEHIQVQQSETAGMVRIFFVSFYLFRRSFQEVVREILLRWLCCLFFVCSSEMIVLLWAFCPICHGGGGGGCMAMCHLGCATDAITGWKTCSGVTCGRKCRNTVLAPHSSWICSATLPSRRTLGNRRFAFSHTAFFVSDTCCCLLTC